ncbi:hypothetical protein [Agromyces archimandritae]|uniref:Uncharacterized protein n=1 Tax=Agromyces archimandritae TaxID=2781962 RepID=A0A975FMH9_9MICO|nr:hypothetical protein [Agromyces archimandritae]QTX04855.1 hypothetical protein G127AT_00880 [Agromyces archimandritae]
MTHYQPDLEGQRVRGFLDDVVGSAIVGQYPVQKDIVHVYLTCVGEGEIRIEIDPIGVFPLDCAATGVASANQFEVSSIPEFTLRVEGSPEQRWAVTIAE